MNFLKICAVFGALIGPIAARAPAVLAAPKNVASPNEMTITNEFLAVTVVADGGLTIGTRAGETVLSGRMEGATTWSKSAVFDAAFGRGEQLQSPVADGSHVAVRVFARLPFALVNRTIRNDQGATQIYNRVPLGAFTVENQSAADLRTRGTGGLKTADKNPGSYVYLAVAQPQTRRGVVAAWLTHDRASGVLFSAIENGKVRINARSDYGKLQLAPGQSATGETLAVGAFDDARLGLEAWADAVARNYQIALPPQPAGYCTWYSDKHGGSSDEEHIAEIAEFAAKNLRPFGLDFVQIDDHWQSGGVPEGAVRNGPNKDFTKARPSGPYAAGMKATANTIRADGLTPGIWFMPFAGTFNDPHFAPHQQWFVKRADGTPYDSKWGGTSLDMTQPGAREYVRNLAARLSRDWGYRYFKMDGIYTGLAAQHNYINDGYKEDDFGDAILFDPSKTNIEAFRDGLKLMREAAGKDVFFLGCTMAQNMRSFGGTIGLVDAMRIGPDNAGNWKAWVRTSPLYGARNYFLNRRIWFNDPDPFYLRASVTTDEARTMASWTTLAGQLNSSSDWWPDLPAERLDILRRTMPAHHATARPVDFFEHDRPNIWTVSDGAANARRDVVGIFNWADESANFATPLASLSLDADRDYVGFDFWANALVGPFKGRVQSTLAPHQCHVLALRPLRDVPQLISTNRHITQGMVDVSDEKWDARAQSLSGRSRIVKNDPYELRFVALSTGKPWKIGDVFLDQKDRAAGVRVQSVREEAGLVRVTLISPENRTVAWKVGFER